MLIKNDKKQSLSGSLLFLLKSGNISLNSLSKVLRIFVKSFERLHVEMEGLK